MEWYKPTPPLPRGLSHASCRVLDGFLTFFPLQGHDALGAAMEASEHAKKANVTVRLVLDDGMHEISPKDVIFQHNNNRRLS